MLALVNANRMTPPIAPIGLDYIAGAVRSAGIEMDLLDLSLAVDADAAMDAFFAAKQPIWWG